MNKQLLFIHGGEAFSRHDDFLGYLRIAPIDPYRMKGLRWNQKAVLEESLGNEWEVFRPQMPNSQNAKYEEWKIWFERHLEFMKDGLVLVGHSQGAMFLARYCAENIFSIKIAQVHLVAGAATSDGLEGEDGESFYADLGDLKNITKHIPQTYLYHSEDDFVVPFKNYDLFKENMPGVKGFVFDNRGHFLQEDFPELIENIKSY